MVTWKPSPEDNKEAARLLAFIDENLFVKEENWTKGTSRRVLQDGTVAHCLIGALNAAGSELKLSARGYNAAALFMLDATDEPLSYSLIFWNDSEARTFSDVKAMMGKAREAARKAAS